ncbi:MAG: FAD-dependent oxidoreductase [Alphaproteobacteria bacterium]
MARDSRYDILFEPVKIGPVTSRNRFFQVPHCNGMGTQYPRSQAAMRAAKGEGGWGVVCTEECLFHMTTDIMPFTSAFLYDDGDIAPMALISEAVKTHGALAGTQLVHHGMSTPNRYSRMPPLGPSSRPQFGGDPVHSKAMDKTDIREFRRWHRNGALRAKAAGFDVVYVYCAHNIALPMHFLSRRYNDRTDEYGGSLENRARLLRELLEETHEAIGDSCAVAVRFAVDELMGEAGITKDGEGRDVVELLAELPDLWDVNISDWPNDSQTSRFSEEGFQEDYISFVKSMTTKPVVGVGRFTSPDTMVSQINRGILDFIGAARPSIADPFLPKKIEEGRPEDIRECIGCNVCVTTNNIGAPMRCTQNPTVGEEWRRGWHPEVIAPKGSDDQVLIVGAGPAGLECALALGQRGYEVHLAEAGAELGGRVTLESALPGLGAWSRVRDYRTYQLSQLGNVSVYRESPLGADEVREFGAPRVVLATGAQWRRDGIERWHQSAMEGWQNDSVLSAGDVMAGADVSSPVVIFDDEDYYLGGVIAEKLRTDGHEVTLATTAGDASHFCHNSLEHGYIQSRLLTLGIVMAPHRAVVRAGDGEAELACVFTDKRETLTCGTVVMVTGRETNEGLYNDLMADQDALNGAGISSVTKVGDCMAPGTIAAAVFEGHRYARELDEPTPADVPFKRERIAL